MTLETTPPLWTRRRKIAAVALGSLQLAVAFAVGMSGLLTNDARSPFPPVAVTAVAPVVLFVLAYNFSAGFRSFVLAQDLETLTRLQLWRVVGFGFLLLYAHGVLPGLFAWLAGVGDVAVGLAAFFVVTRLREDPGYATGNGIVAFHLLGLTDFAFAVATAGLTAGSVPGLIPGGLTSAAMDVWPLNLFPGFIVPAFIIVQVAALLKIRHLRRAQAAHVETALDAA